MQSEELKHQIEDGTYYENAKSWYSFVYMSLISERVLYIVLTTLALLTLLVSLVAVMRLLPIKPALPFVVYSKDVVRELPIIKGLSEHIAEPPDQAVRRFFIGKYVQYREAYRKQDIEKNAKIIYHWSDEKAYQAYYRTMDINNPRSPIVRYESKAQREIEIKDVILSHELEKGEYHYKAIVNYVADVITKEKVDRTYWTADIRFVYQDVKVDQETIDTKTGRMKVEPMIFTVKEYDTRETEVFQNVQ